MTTETIKPIAARLYEDNVFAVLVGYGEYSQLYVDGPAWKVYETFNSEDVAIEVMRKKIADTDDGIEVWTVGEWDVETGEYRDMYAAEPSDTTGDDEFAELEIA